MQLHVNIHASAFIFNIDAFASNPYNFKPMSSDPKENVVLAWTRLLRAQATALSAVEANLKAADLPPLSWYDVLLELQRVGKKGLRPFELERELLLPQHRLSRLLDRIEAEGYMARQPCEADGRGQILVITASGSKLRRRMWPIYGKAVNVALGERLTDNEASTLASLLGKLDQSPANSR